MGDILGFLLWTESGVVHESILAESSISIPDGYSGLNWSAGFTLFPPASYFGSPPFLQNGYSLAVVSTPNIAYNNNPGPISDGPISFFSSLPFTFNSVFITAAWYDNLQITVTASLRGTPVPGHTKTVILSATGPTFFAFDWTNIDEVTVTPSDGTQHPGYGGAGRYFAMDNLDVVTAIPEPSSGVHIMLTIIGLACLRRLGRLGFR